MRLKHNTYKLKRKLKRNNHEYLVSVHRSTYTRIYPNRLRKHTLVKLHI